jgi:hypothetical protein
MLSQYDLIAGLEAFTGPGSFRTDPVTIRSIAQLTGLDFGNLPDFAPKDRVRPGFEGAPPAVTLVTGPESLVS